mgnify:FL=1
MNCQKCKSERIMCVFAHCQDCCVIELDNREHQGYVPYDLGIGGGDDVQIKLCMNCGTVQGTWPNNSEISEE